MRGGTANATSTAVGGVGGIVIPTGFGHGTAGIAGTANARSFAETINGNSAQAQSTASGSSGQAKATAQTNFGAFASVQTTATSQVGGTAPARAFAQAGGSVSSNAINPGQSFSIVTGLGSGPFTVAFGSMGAGGTGQSLTYHESANFITKTAGGNFLVDLLGANSVGTGFVSATFEILSNGNVVESKSFTNLAAANAFFSNDLIKVSLSSGRNIQLGLTETMTGGQGFGFRYAAGSSGFKGVPGPTAGAGLPILAAVFGLYWLVRRRRKPARCYFFKSTQPALARKSAGETS